MNTKVRVTDISLLYKGHNQIKIVFDYILSAYDWDKCQMVNIPKIGRFELYQIEFYSMYHNLAKECNRLFETDFDYSQELIDAVKFKKHETYNISYEYDWCLIENSKGIYEIIHHYWYEKDNKTFIGLGGISSETLGEYDKDSIIAIVKKMKSAIDENYIDKLIYGELNSRYSFYDSIGVQHKKEVGFDKQMNINAIVNN